MLGDLAVKAIASLLGALKTKALLPQLELDPVSSIEAVFAVSPKSFFTDALLRNLIANHRERMPAGEHGPRAAKSSRGFH